MEPSFIIRGGTVIDGTGAPARDGDVSIGAGTIVSEAPSGATEIDAAGLAVLPGLIDAHTHLGLLDLTEQTEGRLAPAVVAAQIFGNAKRLLDAGFTTARDAGGIDGGVVDAVERGLVPGPRLFPSGPVLCQTGGHGDLSAPFHPHGYGVPGLVVPSILCDGPDEVRKAARTALRRGATQIKVCVSGGVISYTDSLDDTQFTVGELEAAVSEARARSTYVTAHAHTVGGIRNGLTAGIECFEHATFLDEPTVDEIKRHGAAIVPTLAVIRVAGERWSEMGIPEDLVPRFDGIEDAMAASVKMAHAAGIPVGSGSDLFGPHQARFGLELALKASILGPMEALMSATSVNARILRAHDRLGTLEPGKLADVIAVRGDPLTDPELFDDPDNVVLVIKGGEIVKDLR